MQIVANKTLLLCVCKLFYRLRNDIPEFLTEYGLFQRIGLWLCFGVLKRVFALLSATCGADKITGE